MYVCVLFSHEWLWMTCGRMLVNINHQLAATAVNGVSDITIILDRRKVATVVSIT